MANSAGLHAQLKALFAEICDLAPELRATRLAELTSDPTMVARALALATQNDWDNARTTKLSNAIGTVIGGAASAELQIGDTVGAWRLVSSLGQGGMGSVFLAERSDGHFQQQAAVKVLQGLPTEEALMLLAKERQILATLTHPNIAHLLDGGATPRGRPYLVIEYVPGLPIDAYCRQHTLSTAAILRLIVTVCRAVSFAHQQLIIHCDLKPSNVLVDGAGRPVLLDFGIARLLNQANQIDDAVTVAAPLAFTPRYASPEQRSGGVIGTASDVFSIGALLRELLAVDHRNTELNAIIQKATATAPADRYGSMELLAEDLERYLAHRPVRAMPQTARYGLQKLTQRRWDVMLASMLFAATVSGFTWRVVQERNEANVARAEAVSQRDSAAVAQRRAEKSESIAVEQRDRATVAESSALTERDRALYAEQEALRAQQEALAQRNLAVASEKKAVAAETVAKNEIVTTREVSEFMESLFAGADPESNNGMDITAVALVDRGRERVTKGLQNQPTTQASLNLSLGRVYENLGKPNEAVKLYEQAITVERTLSPPRPLVLARMLSRMSTLRANLTTVAAAEAPARESLALNRQYAAPESEAIADSLNTLGLVLTSLGKYGEAEPVLKESLRLREKLNGVDSNDVASNWHNLGLHYRFSGQLELAEDAYRRAMNIKAVNIGDSHPRTLNSLIGLAQVLIQLQRFDESETLLRKNLSVRRKLYAHNSERVSHAIHELAAAIRGSGRYRESIALSNEGLAIDEVVFGKTSQKYAIPLNGLAGAYEEIGEMAKAEATYRESLTIRVKVLPDTDIAVARARNNLGRFLMRSVMRTDQLAETQPLLVRAYEVRKNAYPADHAEVFESTVVIAEWYVLTGQFQNAQQWLAEIKTIMPRMRLPQQAAYLLVSAKLAVKQKQYGKAATDIDHYETAMRITYGAAHPRTAYATLERAELLDAIGETATARKLASALQRSQWMNDNSLDANAPQRERLTNLLNSTRQSPPSASSASPPILPTLPTLPTTLLP